MTPCSPLIGRLAAGKEQVQNSDRLGRSSVLIRFQGTLI